MANNLKLPFAREPAPAGPPLRDEAARRAAVDPRLNVVLEASAGTGKTRVLVDRYVNLLRAGVEPLNILTITFTRKAAAEMRERIIARLRDAAVQSPDDAARWRDLRDRLNEIGISTIDAFCLALLREFPLEANLDPGFDVADETAAPRLIGESLDRAMRICKARARDDEEVALLFAQLGERKLRVALTTLLGRRHVARQALDRVLSSGPRDLTIHEACHRGAERLAGAFASIPGGLEAFLACGPVRHPAFDLLARDLRGLTAGAGPGGTPVPPPALRGLLNRLDAHFFTTTGTPRIKIPAAYRGHHASKADAARHWDLVHGAAGSIGDAARALRRDLNVVLSRAVWRVFAIATDEFRKTLDRRSVLDFAELLSRATTLLSNMEEFARSRYLLEARYHHVLVDEFQDTSRAQWELVALLVRAWGEGLGPSYDRIPPSIFIVGDRKQSIYGFRDADVALLDEAAGAIAALRPDDQPVHTITHSFRSVPQILAFSNDVFAEIEKAPERSDAFRYDDRDRFPLEDTDGGVAPDDVVLGAAVVDSTRGCAAAVAGEIARILRAVPVRDRITGMRRTAEPGDIAILFRARESHRPFEEALGEVGIPTYVYKGLGFFDADEVKDIVALLRYLGDPTSDLRAAGFLRSRFVRVSDLALRQLAPGLARALSGREAPPATATLPDEDRAVLDAARAAVSRWLRLADAVPPAELLDRVLAETAYAFEWRGPRLAQARENVKKIRGLVRRIQNRGYLTCGRLADHLDTLTLAEESNAAVDAINAVNLMTIHAAKGLEFPVVFVVGVERGSGGHADPIRVSVYGDPEDAVAIGDFHTEYDEDAARRDEEESKRLLYVAMTRARDRLYLAAESKDGRVRPSRSALGSVLPASVIQLLEQAARAVPHVTVLAWPGPGGRVHRLLACLPPAGWAPNAAAKPAAAVGTPAAVDSGTEDFGPVPDDTSTEYVAVTSMAAGAAGTHGRAAGQDEDRASAGRLVHRLFQFCRGASLTDDELRERAVRLFQDDERVAAGDPARVVEQALDLYAGLRNQDALRSILDESDCLFEVPFSLAPGTASLSMPAGAPAGWPLAMRGVIDCIARTPSGRVIVMDFKTGAPRPSDRAQMDIYLEAARRLFPGCDVEARLFYAPRSADKRA